MDLPDDFGDQILDLAMEHPENEDLGGHPLFPRGIDAVGPDLRKFDLIQIIRVLPGDKREACPRLFKGSELRSWEQIVDLYGGECHYQLQAMCGKTRRYTARSEKFFFGSPAMVPFHPSGANSVPTAQPAPAAPPPTQVAAGYAPPQYVAPPPAPMPPPAPAPPPQSPPSTVTAMMAEITRMITEHNAKMQAQAAAAQQAAPQPQVDPQIEMIRTVAAIINARNEAASSDEAELEFDEPDDDGVEDSGPSGNELGQLAALIAALKAKPAPTPAATPEPPVPVFPERFATPFALMALGIADGFAAWTSFGSGVALLSGYWEKPPEEKCLFFEFANYMVRAPQGIGIAMELLFDAGLREAAKAMMFRWNALTCGQIALERLREMWARDPAMIEASRWVRQRMCAAVMRYLKANPVPEKAEAVAEPEQIAPPPRPIHPLPHPRSASPSRSRTPRTSLGMLGVNVGTTELVRNIDWMLWTNEVDPRHAKNVVPESDRHCHRSNRDPCHASGLRHSLRFLDGR